MFFFHSKAYMKAMAGLPTLPSEEDQIRKAAANYFNKDHYFSIGDEVRTITRVGGVSKGTLAVVVEVLCDGDIIVVLTHDSVSGILARKEFLRWQVEKNGSK